MPPIVDVSLRETVELKSHQNIGRCFACNKCTAGCPVAFAMQYGPHRIVQMVRFGLRDQVLASPDIWLCAGCETCGTRCPNDVDIAHVMDALRQVSLAEHVANPAKDLVDFHQLFFGIVGTFGRMHEASLLGLYKIKSKDLLGDMGAGVQLISKGKIPILPTRIKGIGDVRKINGMSRVVDGEIKPAEPPAGHEERS